MSDSLEQFKKAVIDDDTSAATAALQHAEVREQVSAGIFPYGRPPLLEARSPAMVDLLLDAGADLKSMSKFWEPGFWVDEVPPEVSAHLLAKGATLTIHTASALGLADRVREFLDADPEAVHARGGDGATPLHFARTVEVAELLLDRGANMEARDEDHRSTPAQWRIKFSPDVTRLIMERGAAPDVFIAAGLGDMELARKAVEADPACVTYRIGDNTCPYPGISFEDTGGSILQWNLGFNMAPQEIAMKRGHRDIYDFLMESTPPKNKLQIACMLADRDLAKSLLEEHPSLVDEFTDEDKTLLAKACWETNNDTEAVRLMLECGFPPNIPEHNHCYSPLHNAAWSGNSEVVRLLILHGHDVHMISTEYQSTPVGCAIYSATEGRCYEDVDYGGVIDALIEAGNDLCLEHYPVGHDAIDAVIKKHLDARAR